MKENLRKKLDSTIKKGRKEGFTLVELLVVIAIIAVLATVSVVGYMGFTKKAKVSNDISLTKQMNTALEANKAIKKNNTMSEAVADLEDAGLDVEKLSPTTNGYSYVWDSTSDMMFLLDEKKEVVAPSDKKLPDDKSGVFAILHKEADALDGYAQYLAADYPEQEIQYTVLTSVDTGKSGVKKVTVKADNNGSAIINMNGGTLDFTDGNADVYFYGKADAVDIKAVKDASFHVYGTVTSVKIAKGNVELESGSEVGSVVATDASAKFKKKDGAKLDGVGYTTETKPTGIPEGATKVSSETLSLFAGGIGTEASPYLISNNDQFGKIASLSQKMKDGEAYSFSLISDINISDLTVFDGKGWGHAFIPFFNGKLDGNGHVISVESVIDDSYSLIGNFVGKAELKNFCFKILASKENLLDYVVRINQGNFECSTVVIDDVDYTSDDLEHYFSFEDNDCLYTAAPGSSFYWENTNIYSCEYLFKNCDAKINMSGIGYCGTFLGQQIYGHETNVRIDNCSYDGFLIGNKVSFIQGNTNTDKDKILAGNLYINRFTNKGFVGCTSGYPSIAGAASISKENIKPKGNVIVSDDCNWGNYKYLTDSKLNISETKDGKISLTKASIDASNVNIKYILNITGGTRYYLNNDGHRIGAENSSFRFSLEYESCKDNLHAGYFVTKEQFDDFDDQGQVIDQYNLANGEKITLRKAKDKYYYVFEFKNKYEFGNKYGKCPVETKSIEVSCYNNGNLVASVSCSFNPVI